MPQSLSAAYLHLVFSTKNRRPFLRDPNLRARLHEYLGGISKSLDCHPVRIGGVADHVHLLCRFGRTITQADWIKELKRASNHWLRSNAPDLADFEWQSGCATFSVSASNLPTVETYIQNQDTHHQTMTFQDELLKLLKKHNLPYEEKYLWD